MTDLITWLRAQLDTDERMAREATPGRWHWIDPGGSARSALVAGDMTPAGWRVVLRAAGEVYPSAADAAHIEANAPARALRQVQAHRAILERYEDCLARLHDPEHSTVEAAGQLREYEDFVLPALASIYSDRDGYREEWRP